MTTATTTDAAWRILDADYAPAVLRADGGPRGLHWATYDAGGRRVAEGTDRSCAPTAGELAAWDAQARVYAERAAAFAHRALPLYIRWLDLPRGGRSTNHATGQREAGVSVYHARYNPTTDAIEYGDGGLPGAALTYLLTGAPCSLVTGEHASVGSDGEPVIRQARVLARLQPTAEGFRIIEQS